MAVDLLPEHTRTRSGSGSGRQVINEWEGGEKVSSRSEFLRTQQQQHHTTPTTAHPHPTPSTPTTTTNPKPLIPRRPLIQILFLQFILIHQSLKRSDSYVGWFGEVSPPRVVLRSAGSTSLFGGGRAVVEGNHTLVMQMRVSLGRLLSIRNGLEYRILGLKVDRGRRRSLFPRHRCLPLYPPI